MKSRFVDKLIERFDQVGSSEVQNFLNRLAEESDFFKSIFDALQEGVIVATGEGIIHYINDGASRLFGLHCKSVKGEKVSDHIQGLEWDNLVSGKSDAISRDLELFYPENKYLNFYIKPIGANSENADPVFLMLIRDITESRKGEEEKLESEKIGALTMLAAGVAHEIGNPLNSINIHLQLLERKLKKAVPDLYEAELRDLVETSTDEVRRLDHIVDQFLKAIRPSKPQLEPTDINELIKESMRFLEPEIKDRGLNLTLELRSALPALELDPDQIKQAFYNIVKNSIQATPESGKITVKTLDSFYTGGTVRNITEFVDSTTKSVDKALPYREIVFKYEDTENILAKQHREINQRDWGAISYNSGEVLDSNNNTYEIVAPFQHMKFERLVDGSTTKNIQVGHLLNDKQDPYLGKPVIFYPIHSTNLGVTATAFNFITEIDGYDGGSTDTDSSQSQYWIPSNSPVVLSSGSGYPETINFNVELNEFTNAADYTDSLFEKYYKSYIVNAFRFNERITKIKARLPLKFLELFTLADELQIVDLVYRVNSITTNLQTGESTLELLNGREATAATGSAYATVTISTSSNATPSTACGYTLNNTLYYTGTLGNGVRLYTNTDLTTAFSGTGNNYGFPGSNYGAIDASGYISGYQPCPTLAPVVQTNSTTNITYSSFTMNGNISVANGTISDRGFYWGVNSSYSSNTKVSEGGTATGTFSRNITSGVTPGATYYVTAYATNGNGESQGATVSFSATNAPNLPTVTVLTETTITSSGFTARLEITNDGGATIDAAGFWVGTNNTAYNASGNVHYAITPNPNSIGVKTLTFSSLNSSTTYYYWGTASNTYSSSDGISSSYETVQTLAQAFAYNNITYNASDAYYACIGSSPQTYYSNNNTFGAGITLYTDSSLSTKVANGYYARNNKSYQVTSNGLLGAETACSTTTVFRVRITAAYPGTNYYDMTTVEAAGLSTTNVMYFTAYWGSGRIMYTDVNLTTTYTGSGTWKTDQGIYEYLYGRYPEGKIFFARRQNFINGAWTDLTSTLTTSGYDDYVCQVSSAGVLEILYWNYDTSALAIVGSASMSGIKISTGSTTASGACALTPGTIVYYDGTSISNGTVIYTDSVSAGTSGSSNKFNGGGQWWKFENNYRAQISSTGVVSNYASC